MTDDRERQRLETIVFGRDDAVTEAELGAAGIRLICSAAAPEIGVTWGIGPGVAFGGR